MLVSLVCLLIFCDSAVLSSNDDMPASITTPRRNATRTETHVRAAVTASQGVDGPQEVYLEDL